VSCPRIGVVQILKVLSVGSGRVSCTPAVFEEEELENDDAHRVRTLVRHFFGFWGDISATYNMRMIEN
jgi:hypothetical protein